MKKNLGLILVTTLAFFAAPAKAISHASLATYDAYGPVLISMSVTTPADFLITSFEVSARFLKVIPPGYDITTLPALFPNSIGGAYGGWIYFAPNTPGSHCVNGTHRYYYVGLVGYTEYSPIDCIDF